MNIKNIFELKNIKEFIRYQKALATAEGVTLTSTQALTTGLGTLAKSFLLNPITIGVAALTTFVGIAHKTSQSIDEIRDKASSLGEEFNTAKSDVDGYKEKIKSLYETINDSNSSLEQVTEARKTLMGIQDELIEKFGDEKNVIDIVTDAINGQADALDNLSKKKWQETKNEFNDNNIWGDFANWQKGYKTNIDRMVDEMENGIANLKMSTSEYYSGEYDNIIKSLENSGWKYSSSYEVFLKNDSLQNIYDEIIAIQTEVGKKAPDDFLKSLTDEANESSEIISKYKDIWDNYILNDKILSNNELANSFNQINKAYSEYQNAFKSGDSKEIDKSIDNFSNILKDAVKNSDGNRGIIDYFNNMYPTLKREAEKWEFKTNIIPEFDTSKLSGKTQNDILEMLQTEGIQEGEDIFTSILQNATDAEIVTGEYSDRVQSLLDLLTEWDVLQEDIAESVDKIDISSDAAENIKTYYEALENAKNTGADDGSVQMAFARVAESAKSAGVSVNELIDAYLNLAPAIDDIKTDVTNFASAQESLTTALSEQSSTETISNETLAKLKEQYEGIENAIEFTTDGIVLNTSKLWELNAEQRKNIADELEQKEKALTKQYNEATMKLATVTEYTKNHVDADDSLVASQQAVVDGLESQIADLKSLQKEYENSISTHNEFMKALSSANEGAGYEAVASSLKQVQEQWDKGLIGTDDIRTFVNYMTSEDMSNASLDEITSQFEKCMTAAKEFFTEGSSGSKKFLDLLSNTTVEVDGVAKALATYDKATDTWSIDIDDMKQASEATGYSVDFLIDHMNRLKDYGFNVEFGEMDDFVNYTKVLEDVESEIKRVREEFYKTGGSSQELRDQLMQLEKTKISLMDNIDVSGFEDAINKVKELQNQINTYGDPTNRDQKIAEFKSQQQTVADSIGMTVEQVLGVDTSSAEAVMDAWTKRTEKENNPEVTLSADTSPAMQAIQSVVNGDYTAELKIKLKAVGVDAVKNVINTISNKLNKSEEGKSSLTGTAYANGTGDWSAGQNSKNVLVGELGPEIRVKPDGHYEVLGLNGAEFTDVDANDIVFNHKQSEALLKYGHINSRGKAMARGSASGLAMYTNNTKGKGPAAGLDKVNNTTNNAKDTGKNNDKTEKSTKNLIDWIERRINVLTTKATRWSEIIENATDAKKLNSYYKQFDAITKKQIKTYGDAYNRYMSKANSVGLSKSLQNKVISKDKSLFDKNGNLRSHKELIKEYGEDTYEKVQSYIQWYDKAISAIDDFREYATTLANSPIEKAADKIELLGKSLEVLEAHIDATIVDDYKDANSLINSEIKNQRSQNKANQDALKTAKSNVKAGKSISGNKVVKDNKKAIKDGKQLNEIDLTNLTLGTKKYKQAVQYNTYVEAYNNALLEAQKSQYELEKQEVEYRKQQFDNIEEYYKDRIALIQAEEDANNDSVSLLETKGMVVQAKYYENNIDYENQKLDKLEKSKQELEDQLKAIPQGTSEWYDAKQALADVNSEIQGCNKSIAEMNNNITAVADSIHDMVRDKLSRVATTMDTVAQSWAKFEVFDEETGGYTKEGLATLGTYSTSMNTAFAKLEHDTKVLKDLKDAYDTAVDGNRKVSEQNPIEVDGRKYNSYKQLLDAIDKYTDYMNSDYTDALKSENDIIDSVIQKYEAELNVVQKLTEKKKDALNSEKELYDYQKTLNNSVKNINSIQKQIAALQGDNSQEGIARVQKLQAELKDSREQLADQEYEHTISEQQKMLDTMYSELESLIHEEIKNRDELLLKGIDAINDNKTDICATIDSYADKTNYFDATEDLKTAEDSMLTDVPDVQDNTSAIKGLTSSVDILDKTIKKVNGIVDEDNDSNSTNATTTDVNNPTTTPMMNASLPGANASPEQEAFNQKADAMVSKSNDNAEQKDKLAYLKSQVESVFANKKYFAKGKKEKASDYETSVNQYLFKKNDGKVLTNAGLKQMREIFDVKNNDIYNALMDLKNVSGNIKNVKGFSTGGIGKITPIGEDGLAWVRNGEGFVAPEDVKHIQELLKVVPDVTSIIKPIAMPNVTSTMQNIGDNNVEMNITLPNVTNYEEFEQQLVNRMNSSKNYHTFIQDITINRLDGSAGRTAKNSFTKF